LHILEFYGKFISSKDLIFDIGANIGEPTAVFAQLARKVVAVEPVTASFLKLTEHANEKVFPLHCALSDYHGSGFIHTCAAAPTRLVLHLFRFRG
jgi:FkbM family methyltransferase